MRSAGFNRRALLLDGREIFLFSGEFHYFRTAREQWIDSLHKMKEAHLNAVSLYVPWNWHEPSEGTLDLTGQTHPQRDLVTALDLIAEMGFYIILRPGPFICSEWLHGGYPDWLLRNHPEVCALDATDSPQNLDILYPPVTYLHPTYLEYAARWYRVLLPIVKPRLYTEGGDIIAWQIDDEPNYGLATRCFDPTFADYNPFVVGRNGEAGYYQRWLAEYYGDIATLNTIYKAQYRDFAEITPPRQPPKTVRDLPRYMDWHACKVAMTVCFLENMYDLLCAEGVDVPIFVLYPIMLPYTAGVAGRHFAAKNKPVVLTTQCYVAMFVGGSVPEGVYGHVAALTELAQVWNAPLGAPPISGEIQASLSTHLSPEGMESFYVWKIGHGLNGVNFYMMAGGENPPGFHKQTGRSYDISTPIGARGELRPHYPVIQRLGQFLDTHGERLMATHPLYDIGIGFYVPYEVVAQQGDTLTLDLRDHYGDVLQYYFGLHHGAIASTTGLYSLLSASGLTYALCDLEHTNLDDLLAFPQLWVLGLDFMARDVQEKLVAYVESGGHVVLLPRVPTLDERFEPCSVLAQLLPAQPLDPKPGAPVASRRLTYHTVSTESLAQGLLITDYVDTFNPPPDAEVLAREDQSGQPCAYRIVYGRGSATLLGFKLAYGWDGRLDHKQFVNMVADRANVRRHAWAEGWELLVVERAGAPNSDLITSFLSVVNPTPWPQTAKLHYTDPASGEELTLPRLIDGLHFVRQGGLILLLGGKIPGVSGRLLYCTSQVQTWSGEEHHARLELYAQPGVTGEVMLRLETPPEMVMVNGTVPLQQEWEEDSHTLTVVYYHRDEIVSLDIRWPESGPTTED